jgi:hypothetical protein
MWAECARTALEASELAPVLLSREPRPTVTSSSESIHIAAWRDRGQVVVLAANTENQPRMMRLELAEPRYWGAAEVLFENRAIKVVRGVIEEPIDAYGTRAYALPVGPIPGDDVEVSDGNLTVDPSFEQCASTGIPSAVYASSRPGATHFVDSRVARHGRHSLRLIAPAAEEPARVSPFPVPLKAGVTYRASLWAKAAGEGAKLEVDFGDLGRAEFGVAREWTEYSLDLQPKGDERASPRIALRSAGTVWIDLYQVVPQS